VWANLCSAVCSGEFSACIKEERTMKVTKDLQKKLEKKKRELEELVKSRSKANCIEINSSPGSVTHQMKIEELEDEIARLEKKVSA